MPIATWETFYPKVGMTGKETPTVSVAKFGDGYEARNAIGINSLKQQWPVSFTLKQDDLSTALGFLRARGGYEAFAWKTHPDGVERKVVCREWSVEHHGNGVGTITSTFERVYE